jgi:hypothetical protein
MQSPSLLFSFNKSLVGVGVGVLIDTMDESGHRMKVKPPCRRFQGIKTGQVGGWLEVYVQYDDHVTLSTCPLLIRSFPSLVQVSLFEQGMLLAHISPSYNYMHLLNFNERERGRQRERGNMIESERNQRNGNDCEELVGGRVS